MRPESAKQVEIRLAILPKILGIAARVQVNIPRRRWNSGVLIATHG
jgi:hypothetical protein